MTSVIHFILLCFIQNLFYAVESSISEKRLLKYLFDPKRIDAHDVMERPTGNNSEPVDVRVRVHLMQLIDVDEKNEMIQLSLWVHMRWRDYHFHWNPKSFDGITQISLPPEKVWKPDIVLFNSADHRNTAPYTANVRVFHSRVIQWAPPDVFKATCDIDVTWFPFDKQHCFLKFGSWTNSANVIDMRLDCTKEYNPDDHSNCTENGFINLENYEPNSEFNIFDHSIIREQYDYFNETYVNIFVKIWIERRSLYFAYSCILPCLLVSIMSVLVFILPPDSGEKISLGVTVLLSMTMFLLLVADKLPQSSQAVPLICKYFLCIMLLCSLSIIFTVLVLNLHHRSETEHPPPYWVKITINKWLATILLMETEDALINKEYILHENNHGNITSPDVATTNVEFINAQELLDRSPRIRGWKFAATVIDRLCLIMFSLVIIVSTISILATPYI